MSTPPPTGHTPPKGTTDTGPGSRPDVAEEYHRLEESRMWNVVSYLITGPVMCGGIGLGLDRWLGTSWLVAVGILGGMALSLYVVWVRYGTQ